VYSRYIADSNNWIARPKEQSLRLAISQFFSLFLSSSAGPSSVQFILHSLFLCYTFIL
jgi:hypothetical protein